MPAVPFDIDPVGTPLMVRRRPTNCHFQPLPPGVDTTAARPVRARDVRTGDLILASFAARPTPYRITAGTTWVARPYLADPRPWNPACPCPVCRLDRELCEPGPRIVLAAPVKSRWGVECELWKPDEPALIIPAAPVPPPAA